MPKHGPGAPPFSKSVSRRTVFLHEEALESGGSSVSRLRERRLSRGFAWRTMFSPNEFLGKPQLSNHGPWVTDIRSLRRPPVLDYVRTYVRTRQPGGATSRGLRQIFQLLHQQGLVPAHADHGWDLAHKGALALGVGWRTSVLRRGWAREPRFSQELGQRTSVLRRGWARELPFSDWRL